MGVSVAAMLIAVIASVLAAVSLWQSNRIRHSPDAAVTRPSEWLTGTTEERFLKIERQLRGLDQAMAEIGYRYGELLIAGRARDWSYAGYQAEKIGPSCSSRWNAGPSAHVRPSRF